VLKFPLRDKTGKAFTDPVVIVPADRTLTLDEKDFLASLASQAALLGTYQGLPESTKRILLDFSKVLSLARRRRGQFGRPPGIALRVLSHARFPYRQ
jgi:hypothetical protein